MSGAIIPVPQSAFMAWCLVKHRDNFTFIFTVLNLFTIQCIVVCAGNDKTGKIFFQNFFLNTDPLHDTGFSSNCCGSLYACCEVGWTAKSYRELSQRYIDRQAANTARWVSK
jgi:hypothetical protein